MLRRWLAWSAGLVAAVAAIAHAGEGDAMDQPTDPLARQLALSALTTEQFNLQTARMGTIAEANGRSTLYLGTLSSAVIALAFVGQTSQLDDSFYLFALTLLPPVFLLGVFSYLRLVQTRSRTWSMPWGPSGSASTSWPWTRRRGRFFPPTDSQGMTKLERMGWWRPAPCRCCSRRPAWSRASTRSSVG
jgi:peptidoglycan/LPS O-acetylase OafA/YrhL